MFSYIKQKYKNAKTNLYISHTYKEGDDFGDIVFEGTGADVHIIAAKFKSEALNITPENLLGIDNSVVFDVAAINAVLPKHEHIHDAWNGLRPGAACYLIDKLTDDNYAENETYSIRSRPDNTQVMVSVTRSGESTDNSSRYLADIYSIHEDGLITSKRVEW